VAGPLLSIIIPAHNEELRLPPSLEKIDAFQRRQTFTTEVLVVENGSRDRTFEVASQLMQERPYLQVERLEGRGKGLAVRHGMLAAHGEYRFICDADLSMPIEQVLRFLPPNLEHPAVAIASREVKGAARYHEPEYRHLIGRVFNTLVRVMALPGLQDTQCGFKLFRADVAERVFPLQTILGWTFDVEILFIARRMGYPINEVPIDWYHDPHSKVKVFKDSLRMLLDLVEIRRNAMRGLYGKKVGRED
jgi:glycosyltransferase involved in cell wall biosynthesis